MSMYSILCVLLLSLISVDAFRKGYNKKCTDCASQACYQSLMRCPVLKKQLQQGQSTCQVIEGVNAKKRGGWGNKYNNGGSSQYRHQQQHSQYHNQHRSQNGCYYEGQWTSTMNWYTGPTHTCQCSSQGTWTNCYPKPKGSVATTGSVSSYVPTTTSYTMTAPTYTSSTPAFATTSTMSQPSAVIAATSTTAGMLVSPSSVSSSNSMPMTTNIAQASSSSWSTLSNYVGPSRRAQTEDQEKEEAKASCFYNGKYTEHANWFTGETKTCQCVNGEWMFCY